MAIGVDQWVESADSRIEGPSGWRGEVLRRWLALPAWLRIGLFVAIAAIIPQVAASDFIVRVGINALLLALLAVGLNVSVGWAGLLDLGYVAFYGFGAYGFALLSSDQLGVHLPALLAVPAVVVATAVLGVILSLPSRRLIGDYLAIVTLFFGQIFLELTLNLDRLKFPGTDGLDITGGPNGIAGVIPINVFGYEFSSPMSYFYLLLALVVVVGVLLALLDRSRTGRAWRAVREDAIAAEMMTVPIKYLKMMAFATGAAVAGLAGSVFASFQLGVFPQNFQVQFLIVIYAALILGGAGSVGGAVAGAVVVTVVLDLLRDPNQASIAFYGVILITLIAKLRPWKLLVGVIAATVGFGYAFHAIVAALWPSADAGSTQSTGVVGSFIDSWVLLPSNAEKVGNWAFCALIVGVILLTQIRGRVARIGLLIPVLYLAAFVWETRLVAEPSITRQLLLGSLLIVMMIARPEGLLGEPRVERV
jgi:branched-chain amino acid transport system permease protein